MSIWKKFFGKPEHPPMAPSHRIPERNEGPSPEDTALLLQLEEAMKRYAKPATLLKVQTSSMPDPEAALLSHFGGPPYFEKGDSWPCSALGKPLDFVCQIYNSPDFQMPQEIKLLQLFYDWEESAYDSSCDGWKVKIFYDLRMEDRVDIERPALLDKPKYAEIIFRPVPSFPDYQEVDNYPEIAELLDAIASEDSLEAYDRIQESLMGTGRFQSHLGGYPLWIQGYETPVGADGRPLPLLLQVDSEDNAGVCWGDAGMAYLFYDPSARRVEFYMQCH